MGDKTKIEWTDSSWSPIRARNKATSKIGWHCEHVTPGCEHCYAEGMNKRLGTGLPFKPGHRKDVELFLDEKMLLAPLRWKKPRMIFVCSMTDLFAEFVTDEMIDRVFAVMALCPQHTFQVLTKRSARMRAYVTARPQAIWDRHALAVEPKASERLKALDWPLPNVWLGVSAEDQENADSRIPDLLATPAAVRFVSAEPLLGPILFSKVPGFNRVNLSLWNWWVIVGGESGRGARPMHPAWARLIRDQCGIANVPFFFKQWGEHFPVDFTDGPSAHDAWDGPIIEAQAGGGNVQAMARVGTKYAGRLLDGRSHDGFPRTQAFPQIARAS